MKVSDLKEGILLAVGTSDMRPVVRHREPGRLTFFPDVFAQIGFGNVLPLSYTGYYFYLGKKREVYHDEKHGKLRTKTNHEVMDPHGIVYRVHGREFKNFEPVWKEEDNENTND